MQRMTLLSVLWSLTLSGCFDDAVTIGLGCENDLECGQGQACGPDAVEDDGSATPDLVCGIPQDEGWDACESTERTTCRDFETARSCRNGFWTETDCDALCEIQLGDQLNDGVCGADDPDLDLGDCACAYLVDDESPDGAEDCLQLDIGDETLEVVRSPFESDDAAVYLQTCDEWCKGDSDTLRFEGSVCRETFLDRVAGSGPGFASGIEARLGGQLCVCRFADGPDCEDQPITQCLNTDPGSGLLALCAGTNQALIHCPLGCATEESGMLEFDWCL